MLQVQNTGPRIRPKGEMRALGHHLAALLAQLRAELHGALGGVQLHWVCVVHAHLEHGGGGGRSLQQSSELQCDNKITAAWQLHVKNTLS